MSYRIDKGLRSTSEYEMSKGNVFMHGLTSLATGHRLTSLSLSKVHRNQSRAFSHRDDFLGKGNGMMEI